MKCLLASACLISIVCISSCSETKESNLETTPNEGNEASIIETLSWEKSRFGQIDGVFSRAQYIDIGLNDRLYVRYGPISDSGVELERVSEGILKWRVFAEPVAPDLPHSQYKQEVYVRVNDGKIRLISQGSYGEFIENRDLESGGLIDRVVEDR